MLSRSSGHRVQLGVVTALTVVRNPANDDEFAKAIEELLAEGVTRASDAQGRLRERWPRAVVRPRELSAEPTRVWYAYREGRWIPAD